jgi:hypothetical protein
VKLSPLWFYFLAVTYLVSLTVALERKRAVGLSFYHQAWQNANVAGLLINHFVGGRFVGLESIFAGAACDLQGLLESHIEHPLIHYFHPPMCTRVYLECSFWCWKPARAPAPAWTAKATRNSVGIRSCVPWKKPAATSYQSWPRR